MEKELDLDPGEQMQILKKVIYQNAKSEFIRAEAAISVQIMIMDSVVGMFKEDAYEECLIRKMQKPKETVEHTETKEEFLKEMDKKGLVKK